MTKKIECNCRWICLLTLYEYYVYFIGFKRQQPTSSKVENVRYFRTSNNTIQKKKKKKKKKLKQEQNKFPEVLIPDCANRELAMLPRWSRTFTHLSRLGSQRGLEFGKDLFRVSHRSYAKVAAAAAPILADSMEKHFPSKPTVNLNKMFWSKPSSLALAPDSPLRIEDPKYDGIRHIIFKMLLFYSKTSKSIRGANVAYQRIISQVDKPAIYEVFNLEKTFKTTFSLLVLHMWLYLRRLKEDGKEGVEFGQHLYEIYNHDVELRVSKAGVNLLLTRWMKDLEKIFYGNIVAYDAAMLPEAKQDELPNVIWRNVFSDDGTSKPNDAALQLVQAMARYARRESISLSMTEKEAIYSGNFKFTPLKNP